MDAVFLTLALVAGLPEVADAALPPVRLADLYRFPVWTWAPRLAPNDDGYWLYMDGENYRPTGRMCVAIQRLRAEAKEKAWWHPAWAEAWEAEAERLDQAFRAWDALDDAVICATCPAEYGVRVEEIEGHLAKLRRLIGPAAYYAGTMPDPWDVYHRSTP